MVSFTLDIIGFISDKYTCYILLNIIGIIVHVGWGFCAPSYLKIACWGAGGRGTETTVLL